MRMSGCHHVNLYSSIVFFFFPYKEFSGNGEKNERKWLEFASFSGCVMKRSSRFSLNAFETEHKKKISEILLKHIFIACVIKAVFSANHITIIIICGAQLTGIRSLSVLYVLPTQYMGLFSRTRRCFFFQTIFSIACTHTKTHTHIVVISFQFSNFMCQKNGGEENKKKNTFPKKSDYCHHSLPIRCVCTVFEMHECVRIGYSAFSSPVLFDIRPLGLCNLHAVLDINSFFFDFFFFVRLMLVALRRRRWHECENEGRTSKRHWKKRRNRFGELHLKKYLYSIHYQTYSAS